MSKVIVAISDVHLGYENCNKDVFQQFVEEVLEQNDIQHVVLLGDIVDFWRRLSIGVLLENLEILQKLSNLKAEKHYVIGNHDYSLSFLAHYRKKLRFNLVNDVVLVSGSQKFRFIHGYQLEFAQMLPLYIQICEYLCGTGDAWGKRFFELWFWYEKTMRTHWLKRLLMTYRKEDELHMKDIKNLNKKELQNLVKTIEKPPNERKMSQLRQKEMWKSRLELAATEKAIEIYPEEALVFGHTHDPFCEKDIANTGSWVTNADKKYSYVVIDEGTMELKFFT